MAIQAEFLDGTGGQLFAVHRRAREISDESECFVVVPPFAEEMNRCRYMCTLLGQALAPLSSKGLLTVDPLGTGDSQGEFGQATWQQWGDDIATAAEYARSVGYGKISLLAIRHGALLAFDRLEDFGALNRVLLWQPVTNGKSALTQFLRLRVAAAASRGEDGVTTAALEAEIDAGRAIDIAGYEVSPELFAGLKASRLDTDYPGVIPRVAWITTLPSEDRTPTRAENTSIEKLRGAGVTVDHKIAYGPSYWQVHERTLAPDVIDTTVACIGAAD